MKKEYWKEVKGGERRKPEEGRKVERSIGKENYFSLERDTAGLPTHRRVHSFSSYWVICGFGKKRIRFTDSIRNYIFPTCDLLSLSLLRRPFLQTRLLFPSNDTINQPNLLKHKNGGSRKPNLGISMSSCTRVLSTVCVVGDCED